MIRPVETNLNVLRKKNDLVTTQEEVDNIIKDLEDTLATLAGYGLAAPQISINKQIAIIRVEKASFTLINPKVIEKQDKIIFRQEGCLSLPGLKINTDRYNYMVIESGLEGSRQRYALEGIEAIVLQHEYDHLMGRTILEAKHRSR